MIRWITESLGTGAYIGVSGKMDKDVQILDVRDLVDKKGNEQQAVLKKIKDGLDFLKSGKRLVVCCDYGISRSNAIAAGILANLRNISFEDSLKQVILITSEKNIKIEVINTVRSAVEGMPEKSGQKRILITGGSGFIGSSFIKVYKDKYSLYYPKREEVDLFNGIVDLDIYVKKNDITHAIHLANPRIYTNNLAMGNSIIMFKNVLDVCAENNIRIIYVSGWEVYSGYRSNNLIASEDLPLFPRGQYGETKYLCEVLLNHYNNTYNLKSVVLRSSPVYGCNSDRPKFIFNFIDKAKNGGEILTHKYNNGFPSLDLLNIDDMIRAISLAVENDEIFGSINIGTGKGLTTAEIALNIVKILDSKSVVRHFKIDGYTPNIIMDTTRAKQQLGWVANIVFEEGLNNILNKQKSGD